MASAGVRRGRNEAYARMARQAGYRSRAVYKLMEIDRRDHLFRPGQTVLDLGAAPGGWSQYAAQRVGASGVVIAVDHAPMQPPAGVQVLAGDAASTALRARFLESFGNRRCDLVLSDMAPKISGIRAADQARSLALAKLALDWALEALHPAGALLVKVFQDPGTAALRTEFRRHFQRVQVRKPAASRGRSREFYLLARTPRNPMV